MKALVTGANGLIGPYACQSWFTPAMMSLPAGDLYQKMALYPAVTSPVICLTRTFASN